MGPRAALTVLNVQRRRSDEPSPHIPSDVLCFRFARGPASPPMTFLKKSRADHGQSGGMTREASELNVARREVKSLPSRWHTRLCSPRAQCPLSAHRGEGGLSDWAQGAGEGPWAALAAPSRPASTIRRTASPHILSDVLCLRFARGPASPPMTFLKKSRADHGLPGAATREVSELNLARREVKSLPGHACVGARRSRIPCDFRRQR